MFLLNNIAIRYLFFCSLLFALQTANGQEKKIKFERISLEDGLSQVTIYSAIQDYRGFIWVGTQDGLNRYDGYDFKTYKNNDRLPASLSDNHIWVVYQGNDSSLWVGTEAGGLNLYERDTDTFTHFKHDSQEPSSLSHNHVRSVLEDFHGNLWVGTFGGGLNLKRPGKNTFEHFYKDDQDTHSISSDTITCLYQTSKGALWVGTSSGLNYYEPTSRSFVRYFHTSDEHSLSNNYVSCIFEDSKQRLWVGTHDGLNLMNLGKGTFEVFKNDGAKRTALSDNFINCLLEDNDGNIWVGTELGGLNLFDPLKKHSQVFKAGLKAWNEISHNQVISLMQDKTGVLWVGTYGGGINKTDLHQIKFDLHANQAGHNTSLSNNIVWRIFEAQNGDVWVGTNHGLSVLDKKSGLFENFYHDKTNPESLSSNRVKVVFEDSKKRLWAGTVGGGLDLLTDRKKKEFRHFRHSPENPKSISSDIIQYIYEANDGGLWIGTATGGLNYYDEQNDAFVRYLHDKNDGSTLSHERVNTVFEDADGDFWVGTSLGLNLMDKEKGTFKRYLKKNEDTTSLRHNYIASITQDEHGTLWMASYGGGIHSFDKKTGRFEHFGEYDGLPTNGASGIIVDKYEKLWISTVKGFCKFDPETKEFKYYDENDGLQGKGFNVGSFHKGESGRFYFGGINGFNSFFPDSIKENPYLPDVVFTSFKIFNKEVKPSPEGILKKQISETKSIALTHQDYVFTIGFAGIHYTNSSRNRYQYKLDGFDKDWIYSDRIRFATYTNLEPGQYTFLVKASNSDGLWSEAASLEITVTPPFWQKAWFKFLLGLVIAGGAGFFYISKVYSMRLQKLELERLVDQRTSEILNQNKELEQQKEEILSQRDEIEKKSNMLEDKTAKIEQQKEDLIKTNDSIKIIGEIGQKITSTLNLDQIINLVYESVNNLMDATEFGIGIYDSDKKIIDYKLYIYMSQRMSDLIVSVDSDAERFAIICVNDKTEIIINDMEKEYSNFLSSLKDYSEGDLLESMICLPLAVEDRVVGIISVQSPKKHAYTQNHINMMKTLANYAGIALDNSRAYTKLQEVHQLVESKNKNIIDSIRYAETIQNAFLPSHHLLENVFREHFVIYHPKDVVSGDFYWFMEEAGYCFVAVVDCTGHGVPGAFMSLIGSNALSLIIRHKNIYAPSQILNELDLQVKRSLSRDNERNDDGMDLGLCRIHKHHKEIIYAGAKRPLYALKESGDIMTFKGNKMSIGGLSKKNERKFDDQEIPYNENLTYYLSSDGYVDQCNEERQKIGTLAFHLTLKQNISLTLDEQKDFLENYLKDFTQNAEQRDDITLFGFRL